MTAARSRTSASEPALIARASTSRLSSPAASASRRPAVQPGGRARQLGVLEVVGQLVAQLPLVPGVTGSRVSPARSTCSRARWSASARFRCRTSVALVLRAVALQHLSQDGLRIARQLLLERRQPARLLRLAGALPVDTLGPGQLRRRRGCPASGQPPWPAGRRPRRSFRSCHGSARDMPSCDSRCR